MRVDTDLRTQFVAFDQLTLMQLHDIFHLRDIVFVVGQKITEVSEVDGEDPKCHHAMLFHNEQLIGTARVFMNTDPRVVGRVAIHPDFQRRGFGSVLMHFVQEQLNGHEAELHAQAHLESWYSSLGWRREGDVFMEANIPHVHMFLNAQ